MLKGLIIIRPKRLVEYSLMYLLYMQDQKTKSQISDIYLRLHLHEIIIHICSDLFGFRSTTVWIQSKLLRQDWFKLEQYSSI